MIQVRDIMTPHVVTLSSDATLRDAVDTLVTCRIGGAPVLDRGRIVGVLSAPDVLAFATAGGPRFASGGESAEPLSEDDVEWSDLHEVPSAFFTDLWPEHVHAATARLSDTSGEEWSYLADHTVSEAMSRRVCSISAALEVSAAAQRMLAAGVQRALVTAEHELVGILTTTDILRAVAERRLTERQFVFE